MLDASAFGVAQRPSDAAATAKRLAPNVAGRERRSIQRPHVRDAFVGRLGLAQRAPAEGKQQHRYSLLAERLLALLHAGLSPSEAIGILTAEAPASEKLDLTALRDALAAGQSFASALAGMPGAPNLLVELIRASERTSDLTTALGEYVEYAGRESELRHRVYSAAVYPAVLVVVGVAVLAFLLLVVMPRFSGVYSSLAGPLPWTVRFILAWSAWTREYGVVLVASAVVVVAAVVAALRRPRARAWVFRRAVAMGRLGVLWRQYHLARLYRVTAMLLSGGLTFPQALRMAAGVLPEELKWRAGRALDCVVGGHSPSKAFSEAGIATPVAASLMRVAERTGQMALLLRRTAEYHDQDVVRALERAMKAAEPMIMAFLGVAIGAVVVLLYAPIFELAQFLR